MRTVAAALCLVCVVLTTAVATAEQSNEIAEARALMDSIRDDLVQMRFDEALAAIESFLGRPRLTEGQRGEALVLRAQAHAAFGDFNAVEQDYTEILMLRPGYLPDASLTPEKAMTRYDRVRKRMIGSIRISLVPEDATLWIDGVESTPNSEGVLSLLSGEHTVRAERRGHDPAEQTVEVIAATEIPVGFDLLPNSRTVIVRTDPAGVLVLLDGERIGVTAPDPDAVGLGPAEARLVIEDVALGDHIFELSKECFRSEKLSDNLNVDLLSREPKLYKTVRMTPARSRITLRGSPSSAVVSIDGEALGVVSAEPVLACPGTRTVAVSVGDRIVWQETLSLGDSANQTLDVVPRPNVVLVGSADWPRRLQTFGAAFNVVGRRELPGDDDLHRIAVWEKMRLGDHVDLAFAVVAASRQGGADRWYLYSPVLNRVALVDGDAPDSTRPAWTTVTWGFDVADTRTGGANRVVGVTAGGAAASAGIGIGDRIVDVAGREVATADQTRATLTHARADKPLRVKWITPSGESLTAELKGRLGPWLVPREVREDAALVRAAWAVLETIARPQDAAAAMANLGLLFSTAGQPTLAADAWRRVDWGERVGVGEGTKQYYLGRALEALGQEEEAIRAYRKAAASRSTTFTDQGPPVAPAALDRLADLGVTPD